MSVSATRTLFECPSSVKGLGQTKLSREKNPEAPGQMAERFRGSLLLAGVMLWCVSSWTLALSCDSCGRECASACGTRSFRTCCFNYLRKRGDDGPGLRLELIVVPPELTRFWTARSAAATAAAAASTSAAAAAVQELPPSSRMQLVYNA